MYKCNTCKCRFIKAMQIKEESGEKVYVCPICRSDKFSQLRSKSDDFLYTEKSFVIETVLSALSALNENDSEGASVILIELVGDLLGRCLFEYEQSLKTVTDHTKSALLSELTEILEVEFL